MSAYTFAVADVFAEPYAAAPQLTARLHVTEDTGAQVHAIALRCQVRIEPQRRGYDDEQARRLAGLFGGRERWADTLRPFLWMQCNTTVQGFTGETEVDLPMPCTYDMDVVGSNYLHAVGSGPVRLTFLYSGTVFLRQGNGFGVEQVPWDCDSSYQMPAEVWTQMMESYFPGTGWIRIHTDVLDDLAAFRAERGLTSWEETLQTLLSASRSNGQPVEGGRG